MNRQRTLANAFTFEKYKKTTKREKFLAEMERVVPWKELNALIEPFYPKGGEGTPSLRQRSEGLPKNTNFIFVLFALSNLYMVRRELLRPTGA